MKYTPEGYSTLTPVIISKDAKKTIKHYQDALGAKVTELMQCPKSGMIMHANLTIGDSTIFVSDEAPEMGNLATGKQTFYLYVENVDASFDVANSAGYSEISKPEDFFWGDRIASVLDMDDNTWKLVQKVRYVSPEEIEAAMKAMSDAA